MIGLDPAELVSVRTLIYLLRHPDPVVSELTLQALSYLEARASEVGIRPPDQPTLDQNSARPVPEVYRRRTSP
jgi:hypothetical protein